MVSKGTIRGLKTLFQIALLTIYAPIELTRVIIMGLPNSAYWGIPVWQFMLEIALFWTMYVVGIIIVYKLMRTS